MRKLDENVSKTPQVWQDDKKKKTFKIPEESTYVDVVKKKANVMVETHFLKEARHIKSPKIRRDRPDYRQDLSSPADEATLKRGDLIAGTVDKMKDPFRQKKVESNKMVGKRDSSRQS